MPTQTKARVIENVIEIPDALETRRVFNAAVRRRTRELRKAAGLSQAQVAEALGMTQQTYSHFESRSVMPLHLMPAFARLVGTDCNSLLTGEPPLR